VIRRLGYRHLARPLKAQIELDVEIGATGSPRPMAARRHLATDARSFRNRAVFLLDYATQSGLGATSVDVDR
jgi:hypothetical protein